MLPVAPNIGRTMVIRSIGVDERQMKDYKTTVYGEWWSRERKRNKNLNMRFSFRMTKPSPSLFVHKLDDTNYSSRVKRSP